MRDRAAAARKYPARYGMFVEGKTDREISDEEGCPQNTITVWRMNYGLVVNHSTLPHPLTMEQSAARRFLYDLGWSDHRIAKEQRCSAKSVRVWRCKRSLPANFQRGVKEANSPSPGAEVTWAHVQKAVGRLLPPDIAADAAADIMLDILEGKLATSQVDKSARSYGNRVLDRFASRFGPRSLDAQIADHEGFTLLDTLADESSGDWLEESGATVC